MRPVVNHDVGYLFAAERAMRDDVEHECLRPSGHHQKQVLRTGQELSPERGQAQMQMMHAPIVEQQVEICSAPLRTSYRAFVSVLAVLA